MTIADLKPYPGYKPSGVEWLGEVPAHWDVERLKRCMANIIEQTNVRNDNELYVGLEHVESWTGRLTEVDEDIEFDSQVKSFEAGDILFGKLRPYLAKVTRPTRNGVCVGEFLVLRPRDKRIVGACIERSLRAKPMIDAVDSSTFGAKMPRADWQFVGAMPIAVPPVTEQIAIVRFLDHADRRIQRYIHAKEKLIALLEEQKQVVIHQAVTGRIDVRTGQPYLGYKSSGVEWLGAVPAHWERRRLKSLLRPIDSRSITGEETLLSLRRDHGVVIYAEHFARPPQGSTHIGFKLVDVGHLVVNRLQANNGLVFRSGVNGLVSPDYSVFEPTQSFSMQYLSDLLRTVGYRAHFRRHAKGLGTGTSGFLRLYDNEFLATTVFLPPEQEQGNILHALENNRVETLERIKKQERQLSFISEYRTRLIADVVTGKLDVREAAAALPEEPGEPEGGDDGRTDDRWTAVSATQEETTP